METKLCCFGKWQAEKVSSVIQCGSKKSSQWLDSNFESIYQKYMQCHSFASYYYDKLQEIEKSKLLSLEITLSTVLLCYPRYFGFLVTILAIFASVKIFAWQCMQNWMKQCCALLKETDLELRKDPEIIESIVDLNAAYIDGTALYLYKEGNVSKYLALFISRMHPNFVWFTFRTISMTLMSIALVLQYACARDLLVIVFVYDVFHEMLFSSYLFHYYFYESYQSTFDAEYAHWSKISIELIAFVKICALFMLLSYLLSFCAVIAVTLGSYSIVRCTVGQKYKAFTYGDCYGEWMHIGVYALLFAVSVSFQML